MQVPLHRRGAVELARMLAEGEASPETVMRSFIDAMHAREAQVQAFAWFDADHALASARALHGAARRGPLHGLPFAVKDNIDTADAPTTYGSVIYDGYRPPIDAVCVSMLKDAGGVMFGKTALTEFANFTPCATRNPRNQTYSPGGSSSGSAAAVAAHCVPIALGTQTAGSVIRPAAYCGVVGYNPSPRLVPRMGVKPNSDTLDEVGVFANSVADAALAASVLAARPAWRELPAQGLASGGPVFGAVTTPQQHLAAPSMLAALERATQTLCAKGARVTDVTWPRVFDGLFDAQKTVQAFETARALATEYTGQRERLSARLAEGIEQGRGIAVEQYTAALQLGRACAAAIESLFGVAEVLLTPSAPGEAPVGLTSTGDPVFNRPWHLLGCPMLNLPVPQALSESETGLPLGLCVVARPGDDARLWAHAAWIEAAWRDVN
ncbi:MAG: amidase [Betaproteobacteria bacterium]